MSMESMFTAIRFGLRRTRLVLGDAAGRAGLTHLPPVPATLGLVVVGLLVPLSLGGPARPSALAGDIATRRIERYLATVEPRGDHAGPTGAIYSLRPCFHWPAHPDAARYSFRLVRDDGATVILTDLLDEPRYLRRAPANLEPGRSYRFEAKALGAQGDALGWAGEGGRKIYVQQGASPARVLDPTPELAELVERARLELDAAETAWVLAGYFTTIEAPADVATALETYLDHSPHGAHAGIAHALLERLGCR